MHRVMNLKSHGAQGKRKPIKRQQAKTKVVQQPRVSDEVMAEHDNTALCLPPQRL